MPIGDPLVKGTATKDNIPLLEVKVSHFAHLGFRFRVINSARRRLRVTLYDRVRIFERSR